jgi:multidrug efflux pump subunit AcrA (membrane-fusion protein)
MRSWLLFLIIFLASCAPVTVTPPSVAMQSIEATQQAAADQAQLEAQAALATQQALETQMALSDELAELQLTAQALEIEQIRKAQQHTDELANLEEQRQELELQERAAGIPLTQVAYQATATAIVAESQERVSQQHQTEVMSTLLPVLLCVGGFTLIGASGYGLVIYLRAKVDRQRYVETSLGPVLLLPGGAWNNLDELEELSAPPQLIESHSEPRVWVSRGGVTAKSSPRAKKQLPVDDYALVRNFVRHASQCAGPMEQQFPHYSDMGWTSEKWQKAKNILQDAELVFSKDREGTWVNPQRYPNLGALSAAVHMQQVKL